MWESNGLFLSVVLHLMTFGPFGVNFSTYLLFVAVFLMQIPLTEWQASKHS